MVDKEPSAPPGAVDEARRDGAGLASAQTQPACSCIFENVDSCSQQVLLSRFDQPKEGDATTK